jgi:PKD repeat protein
VEEELMKIKTKKPLIVHSFLFIIFCVLTSFYCLMFFGCGGGKKGNPIQPPHNKITDEQSLNVVQEASNNFYTLQGSVGTEQAIQQTIASVSAKTEVKKVSLSSSGNAILVEDVDGRKYIIMTSSGYVEPPPKVKESSNLTPKLKQSLTAYFSKLKTVGNNKAIVLDPIHHQIHSKWDNCTSKQIADILTAAGFEVKYCRDEECTVDVYQTLPSYSIIYQFGHGAADDGSGGWGSFETTMTGEKYVAGKKYPNTVVMFTNTGSFYAITDKFINSLNGTFPKSFVYHLACSNFVTQQFAKAYKEKGAYVFLGWDSTTCSSESWETDLPLFTHLASDKSTLQQVFEAEKNNPEFGKSVGNCGGTEVNATLRYYPSSSNDVSIINTPPEVTLTANPTSGRISKEVGLTVTFTGTASDSNGYITKVEWDLDGDRIYESSSDITPIKETTIQKSFTYNDTGTFTPSFRATDDDGVSITKSMTITIPNQPPTGSLSADKTSGTAPLSVTFTIGYTDPEGKAGTYSLDYGDGTGISTGSLNSDQTVQVKHTYSSIGVYTATLIVTDNKGATERKSVTIAVDVWQRTYGVSGSANSIQQTRDGGYIVAGNTYSDFYIIKLDASGNEVWEKTYGGSDWDVAYSIQQTSDGGYIVAGETSIEGTTWPYIIKLDSSGNKVWEFREGFAASHAYSIQQTTDGGYVVAGESGGGNFLVIKLDANGRYVWYKTYNSESHWGDDVAFSIQQTNDGGYVVAGSTGAQQNVASNVDVYIIKLDASGNKIWEKTYGGSSGDVAYSIQQTSDGGYIVAGMTVPFGVAYPDVYIIKLDEYGNQIWEKTYGGSSGDVAYSIQQTSDGGYIVAGSGSENIIKLDSNGNKIWGKSYDGGFSSIQQTSDGGYIVAGAKKGEIYIIKTDANGNTGPIELGNIEVHWKNKSKKR